MNTTQEYKECPDCEGKGGTMEESIDFMNNIPEYTARRCTTCEGLGEVPNEDYEQERKPPLGRDFFSLLNPQM